MGQGTTLFATVGGHAGHVTPPYYADFLRENLYPSAYFRQLGTQVTIPRGYGDRVKIPRWDTPIVTSTTGQGQLDSAVSAIEETTEGTAITPHTLSAESITGSVIQFAGARKYSDKLIIVTKANFIEGALESLGRELAFKTDRHSRNNISASATLRNASGLANALVRTSTVLRGKEVARIAPFMDSNNVPRWEDNSFVGICHPLTQFDLYSDISATGWVSISRYGDVTKIYKGEVGQMFGIRFLLSNLIPLYRGGNATLTAINGLCAAATGSNCWVFAPDAFYSIELEDGGVEVLHMPPGSSGSVNDPAAQIGSIAVKLFYGIAAAPSGDQRLMRFSHGLGLQY